ncbi:alpha/beta hydrolase [Polyangium spumosum]|uniref:Alpha/beta hydrolase n=2 Tax=Polyangium spumosum TaxID=889282 RepID=A0A6N7PTI5_9BACT|nr:alpha/beta hydrolase [Polyangium spumosum]
MRMTSQDRQKCGTTRATSPMSEPVVHLLGPFHVPGLSARHVRVYVPPRRGTAKPPVFYLFDGQNLFHDEPSFAGGWHLHEVAGRLAARGERVPVIVGIDHGGHERIDELSPFPTHGGAGRLELLLDWMRGGLGPHIEHHFGVSTDPLDTGVGGSSMGGLAALYVHHRAPDRFGLVMSMSPSLQIGQGALFGWLDGHPRPRASRIYLDAGAQEAGGGLLRAAERLAETFARRGYDASSLKFVAAKRGAHDEKSWRRRAPGAIRFLFGRKWRR